MMGKPWQKQLQLWYELVVFEVRKQYAGSALGLVWAFLQPLLFLSTYFILLHVILNVHREGWSSLDSLVLMLSGLVPWRYFATTLGRGTAILNSHAPLIKQIRFPIDILPFVTVAQVTVEALIGLSLLLLLGWYAGYASLLNLLLFPALLLFALFLVGVSSVVGCYSIMLPDIQKLLPTALRIMIFLTPVLYLPSRMPESLRFLSVGNPISYFISCFRYAILQDPRVLIISAGADLAICAGLAAVALGIASLHRGYVRGHVVDYL